jgi:VanZ family protein
VKEAFNFRWWGWLSAVIVAGYFIVGLWPFAFRPPNHVSWLTDRAGLHFEKNGVALDPESLPSFGSNDATNSSANFTLEIWAEADREPNDNVYHLLTIHNDRLPADFVICQWRREFLLRATIQHPFTTRKISEVGVSEALLVGKPKFITIRGDGTGTDFFSDGLPAGHYPQFVLKPEALDGQLILGNDSSGKHPWSGSLFGLAVYNRALNAAEIAEHHTLWMQSQAGQLTNEPGLTALYLFDEGGGRRANDSSGSHHQIIIPEIFQPVHKEFLIPPWKDLSYNEPDYSDIAVNILGFMPFGFCFFLHRRFVRPNQLAANFLFVVLVGALVSLTIEIIQAWLPNRVSSTTDLLTNAAGTLLGAVLALAIRPKITPAKSEPEAR